MMYNDFIEAGFRIFGLHGVDRAGHCACGGATCKALYKHPVASNWQHSPHWSDEQLEVMQLTGQLDTGYGVLVSDGLLVVDVDARNGGVESYARLLDQCPEIAGAGLVVNTGSGGGSKHRDFGCRRMPRWYRPCTTIKVAISSHRDSLSAQAPCTPAVHATKP